MSWCDPKDWEILFPKDTLVRCEYARRDELPFQFDAISTGMIKNGTLLVKVIRGSGHARERDLHDGGLCTKSQRQHTNDYWFMYGDQRAHCKIAHYVANYDPLQNGDTDEDV